MNDMQYTHYEIKQNKTCAYFMGYAGYHAVETDVEVGIVPVVHCVIILISRELFMYKNCNRTEVIIP